jgi:hypothetical protein
MWSGNCRLLLSPSAYSLVSLEQHHSSSLVTRSQIIASVVEFDGRDNVRFRIFSTLKIKGPYANKPSVMSSTSPLSPKHLWTVLAHTHSIIGSQLPLNPGELKSKKVWLPSEGQCEHTG